MDVGNRELLVGEDLLSIRSPVLPLYTLTRSGSMDFVGFVRSHVHLTREHLVDYINGNLEEPLLGAVKGHIEVCQFCRNDVEIWTRLLHLPEMGTETDEEVMWD